MKALLLAAGYGTRLSPITDKIPKCLVPINGKPLIEYWLDNLYNAGVNEFLINTHYLAEQVQAYIDSCKYKDMIKVTYEKELLFTGGTLKKNKNFFTDENFMVIHADNLCFCNFNEFIKTHINNQNDIIMTMMTFFTEEPKNCGVVDVNKNNIITGFYEKVQEPPTNLANGAVYIFNKKIFEILDKIEKDKIDLSTEVIPLLVGKIGMYLNNVYLKDIGTIKNYALAQIEVLDFI